MTEPISSEQAAETIWRLATPTPERLDRVAHQILHLDDTAAQAAYLAATNADAAAAHRIADRLDAEHSPGGRLHALLHFAHPSEFELDELRHVRPATMHIAQASVVAGLVLLPVSVVVSLLLGAGSQVLIGITAAFALISVGAGLVFVSIGSAGRERQAIASAYMISLEMALLAVATYDKIGTGGYTREHFEVLMGPWSRGVHPIHIG